jgi:hypothetical protein
MGHVESAHSDIDTPKVGQQIPDLALCVIPHERQKYDLLVSALVPVHCAHLDGLAAALCQLCLDGSELESEGADDANVALGNA